MGIFYEMYQNLINQSSSNFYPRRKMSSTKENLKNAFAGESQAYHKYRAFAKRAEQDGFPNIGRLFRTAAEAERIHAEGHLKSMDAVETTVDNLKSAIAGETYEFSEMYPPMLDKAEKEEHKSKRMFKYAVKAEEVHAKLYKKALEAAKKGNDLDESQIYLCPICGYIEFGIPPEKCPVCATPAAKFKQV